MVDVPQGPSSDNPPSTTSTPSTSTSTSTSNSSSSTSSTPAGPSQAERRAMDRLRSSYLAILRSWGMRTSKNLLNLVERGVRGQWTSTQFIEFLRQTPDYRKRFAGIQWRGGMSEAQYLSLYSQYKNRAKDIGERLNREQFAKMLKRGVTFEEFSDRVNALNAIEEYAPLWDQFQQVLELRGVAVPGGKLSKKELQKFIMGLGDKRWEQIYEEAIVSTNLEKVAGISVAASRAGEAVAPDSYDITRGDLLNIIKSVEALTPGFEVESISSRDWAEIGRRIRQYDISYLQRYGITSRDLLEMELGGPGAATTAEKAERILAEQEAFSEPRAIPQASMQVGGPQQEELPQSR